MKEFKLVSMVDYVIQVNSGTKPLLDQIKKLEMNGHFDYSPEYSKILRYANLLKTPLELGQFIPCKDGKPLKFPVIENDHSDDCHCKTCIKEYTEYGEKEREYQEAQSKVIFKGFEEFSKVNGYTDKVSGTDGRSIYIHEDGTFITNINGSALNTIESLSVYELTLTETAIKMIK